MSDRPSIWDGSVQDKGFQLRQEQLIGTGPRIMKTEDTKTRMFKTDNGTCLVEVDYVRRQLWIRERFIGESDIAEFEAAVVAARKELEAANA